MKLSQTERERVLELADKLKNKKESTDNVKNKAKEPLKTAGMLLVIFIIIIVAYKNIANDHGSGKSESHVALNQSSLKAAPRAQAGDNKDSVASEFILDASGYIVARRVAKVSPEVSGRLDEMFFEEGDAVIEGQELARINSDKAKIVLALAEKDVEIIEAQVNVARKKLHASRAELVRENILFDKRVISETQIIEVRDETDLLALELSELERIYERAKLNVSKEQKDIENHIVSAPFSGVVIKKNGEIGEVVSSSSTGDVTRSGLCTIVDMSSLEIAVDVSESLIGLVKPGQEVGATLDAYPDDMFDGQVLAIIPAANRNKGTHKVRIKINNLHPKLVVDMGVRVRFKKDETEDNHE